MRGGGERKWGGRVCGEPGGKRQRAKGLLVHVQSFTLIRKLNGSFWKIVLLEIVKIGYAF